MNALTEDELARYQWQLDIDGFGEAGQERLKAASVLVSRVGGVGGLVAYQLAAAGVGKLVLAHAGNVKPSDLNRQLLMTTDWIGKPRTESMKRRLAELNPNVEIETVAENVHASNADGLVEKVDLVVDCAPLFEERLALNGAIVKQQKPMVECAMYELEAQLTTILPGQTACLACNVPQAPPAWTRKFPVLGAVSGAVACLAAMEAIKQIAGFGELLAGTLLQYDLRSMEFHKLKLHRRSDCNCCGHL